MTTAPANEGIATIIWNTIGVHASTVHGGRPDTRCDACTRLLIAIAKIEKQGDDHSA